MPGFAKECLVCGGRFEAKRAAAKYCSGRCRQRAYVAPPKPPARREGAPLVTLAPSKSLSEDGGSFAADTRRELETAGRLDTYYGRAAMYLARVADADSGDTGSGHASLMKQYLATMERALDGVQVAETPLEKIRRERDLMAG